MISPELRELVVFNRQLTVTNRVLRRQVAKMIGQRNHYLNVKMKQRDRRISHLRARNKYIKYATQLRSLLKDFSGLRFISPDSPSNRRRYILKLNRRDAWKLVTLIRKDHWHCGNWRNKR